MSRTRRARSASNRDGYYPSVVFMDATVDGDGTFKINKWSGQDWTGSRARSRRYVNSLRRIAGKRQIIFGYHDYLDGLEPEDWYYDYDDYYEEDPIEDDPVYNWEWDYWGEDWDY